MAKNKKKQQKTKKGKKRSAQPRGGHRGSGLEHLAMGVCSVTNPFCDEAVGARWPDNSHTKSIGWGYQNQLQLITTTAGGLGSVLFTSTLENAVFFGSVAGTTATYSSAGQPLVAPPSTSRYRMVCWGLRINSSLSKMTATGTCHVRLFSPELYGPLGVTDIVSTMADAAYDIPISRLIDQDVFILPMPLGTDAHLFTAIGSSAAIGSILTVPLNGWQTVQVAVSGAPASSTALNVYAYAHFEIIPQDGDAANAFSRAAPPANPAIQAANAGVLERIGNFFEGTAERLDAIVKSKSLKYLSAGVGAWYGGPRGAVGAYSITDRGQQLRIAD